MMMVLMRVLGGREDRCLQGMLGHEGWSGESRFHEEGVISLMFCYSYVPVLVYSSAGAKSERDNGNSACIP